MHRHKGQGLGPREFPSCSLPSHQSIPKAQHYLASHKTIRLPQSSISLHSSFPPPPTMTASNETKEKRGLFGALKGGMDRLSSQLQDSGSLQSNIVRPVRPVVIRANS